MKKLRGLQTWIGLVFLVGLVLFAVFVPRIRSHQLDPREQLEPGVIKSFDAVFVAVGKPLQPPGAPVMRADGTPTGHTAILGTDEQGRDILARLAQGARVSLIVGGVVQLFALTIGIFMGVVGSFGPKIVRTAILRFTDAMFAFPDILLAILIVGLSSVQGIYPVIIALAVGAWPATTRLVVTQIATLRDREYVVAARAMGASTPYIVVKHILPHLWGVLLAVSMIEIAGTILAESTLSFLGIGVQAPDPSWGNMINTAREQLNSDINYLIWPCLILSLTIFALNFFGDGLRAALDPKNAD